MNHNSCLQVLETGKKRLVRMAVHNYSEAHKGSEEKAALFQKTRQPGSVAFLRNVEPHVCLVYVPWCP